MTDRDWFQVETSDGQVLGEHPNRAAAEAHARQEAVKHEQPLILLRLTRRSLRHFRRVMTVEHTDVPTPPA